MKSREFQERMGTEDFLFEVLDLFEEDISHEVFIQTADVFELITCPQALTELMSKLSRVKKRVHARSVGDGDIDSSAKVPLSMEAYQKQSWIEDQISRIFNLLQRVVWH